MRTWQQFGGVWHYVQPDRLDRYRHNLWLRKRWQQGANLLSACDHWFCSQWSQAVRPDLPETGAICVLCREAYRLQQTQDRLETHLNVLGGYLEELR